MRRAIGIVFGLAGAALLGAGCGGQAHLSDDYGDKSRAHFESQRVSQEPAEDTPDGLDPEEASIIHRAYRQSISGNEAAPREAEPKVLVVEEPK